MMIRRINKSAYFSFEKYFPESQHKLLLDARIGDNRDLLLKLLERLENIKLALIHRGKQGLYALPIEDYLEVGGSQYSVDDLILDLINLQIESCKAKNLWDCFNAYKCFIELKPNTARRVDYNKLEFWMWRVQLLAYNLHRYSTHINSHVLVIKEDTRGRIL